jgi:hypothetical protein
MWGNGEFVKDVGDGALKGGGGGRRKRRTI